MYSTVRVHSTYTSGSMVADSLYCKFSTVGSLSMNIMIGDAEIFFLTEKR